MSRGVHGLFLVEKLILHFYKTITDNAFLYKALEESNSRYENANYLG